MGQAVSNILKYLCGNAEDEGRSEERNRLICQGSLNSSASSDSCSDSSTSGALIAPFRWDLDGHNNKNGAFDDDPNLLVFQEFLDSYSNSSITDAFQQEVPITSSSSFESSGESSTYDSLQQEALMSSPSLESSGDSRTYGQINPTCIVVDTIAAEVVDQENTQFTRSFLEQNSLRREKEKVSKGVAIKERWINHYSSRQKILLVGEGDFSFSASLAVAFRCAINMIATSLDSNEFLRGNYGNAVSNIQNLKCRGCKVIHGIDATEMVGHPMLIGLTFDRIVFNFPHAGLFKDKYSRKSSLRGNRRLVGLFLANAKEMITENCEIHITHKSNGFFREWNLEQLASNCGLRLIEEKNFNFEEYPGYCTKFGFGGDYNFNCKPSKTYKFGLKTSRN